MSSFQITAERLTVLPHPDADRLELAEVGLYRAVVAKGRYRSGDYALYIPEQAVLPEPLIAELGLAGKLAGAAGNRVKAVRLRGQLSQGVVCSPGAVGEMDLAAAEQDRTDFASLLGVIKWNPPVPVNMSGDVEAAPDLIRWIDIENVKRFPDIFEPGEAVVATEKVHGTACLFSYFAEDGGGRSQLSSKGIGAQYLALKPSEGNLYWRAARAHGLTEAAERIAAHLGVARVGLFGEVYGAGVQDLHYGASAEHDESLGYALFDIAVVDAVDGQHWLSHDEISALFDALELRIPRVPVLYQGPYGAEALLQLAEGRETLSGRGLNIREGLVVRPRTERRSAVLGGRAIGKIVSAGYLLRDGGTEYE
jgi:RNA ligase (TIGR02306 family)